MAEYEKAVRAILMQNNCVFMRHGKGEHDIWYSPIFIAYPFLTAVESDRFIYPVLYNG